MSDGQEMLQFPPMYTLQPVEATRERQLVLWKRLILSYCEANKLNSLDLATCPLFENKKIARRLTPEAISAIVDALIRDGNAEWEFDKLESSSSAAASKISAPKKSRIRILTKTLVQWAAIIYDYAVQNGMLGTVYTVYEIHSGDVGRGSPFFWNGALCLLSSLGSAGKAEKGGNVWIDGLC